MKTERNEPQEGQGTPGVERLFELTVNRKSHRVHLDVELLWIKHGTVCPCKSGKGEDR